jgi:hypothetical protein
LCSRYGLWEHKVWQPISRYGVSPLKGRILKKAKTPDCSGAFALEGASPGLDLELVTWLADIGQIDRQDISAINVFDVLPAALGLVFACDVVG